MIHNRRSKIADLGLARIVTNGGVDASKESGTLIYMSPEQMENGLALTFASDVYAFGGIMYFVISGSNPWNGVADTPVFANVSVLKMKPTLPAGVERKEVPHGLIELMDQCLESNASDRPPIASVLAELQQIISRLRSEVDVAVSQ